LTPYRYATIFLTDQKMPSQYIPTLIVAILVAAFPVIGLAMFKRVRSVLDANEASEQPETLGSASENATTGNYWAQFYLAGMLFVVFDVAIVFLFPWAIKFSQMSAYGFVVILPFIGIVLVGYAWLYKKGALDWV
jgi:NADH-quinone oxidoreductase subunit A